MELATWRLIAMIVFAIAGLIAIIRVETELLNKVLYLVMWVAFAFIFISILN